MSFKDRESGKQMMSYSDAHGFNQSLDILEGLWFSQKDILEDCRRANLFVFDSAHSWNIDSSRSFIEDMHLFTSLLDWRLMMILTNCLCLSSSITLWRLSTSTLRMFASLM